MGLRIDVDTLRGTRRGLPALLELLDGLGILASFYLSVGPDNMGRHLWRLAKPRFLTKMLRTRATRLYGWDILLRGTIVPGPIIGRKGADAIRELARSDHEIGLHAWDHHAWQNRIDRLGTSEISEHLRLGAEMLEALCGEPPHASAAPAWRTTDAALRAKRPFGFHYNSDCRGSAPFLPLLDDGTLGQPQIPATLPTYDERAGVGTSGAGYYEELLDGLGSRGFEVLTIHAEVEGIATLPLFARFLERALAAGHRFATLAELASEAGSVPVHRMTRREIPGREGWVSWQGERVELAARGRVASGVGG